MDKVNAIAHLNDTFRRSRCRITILTPGVQALADLVELLKAVRQFDTFTEENDPCGHHDFGAMVWRDQWVFWQIDCYDYAFQHRENPLSATCRRVMTIMLASEY